MKYQEENETKSKTFHQGGFHLDLPECPHEIKLLVLFSFYIRMLKNRLKQGGYLTYTYQTKNK